MIASKFMWDIIFYYITASVFLSDYKRDISFSAHERNTYCFFTCIVMAGNCLILKSPLLEAWVTCATQIGTKASLLAVPSVSSVAKLTWLFFRFLQVLTAYFQKLMHFKDWKQIPLGQRMWKFMCIFMELSIDICELVLRGLGVKVQSSSG